MAANAWPVALRGPPPAGLTWQAPQLCPVAVAYCGRASLGVDRKAITIPKIARATATRVHVRREMDRVIPVPFLLVILSDQYCQFVHAGLSGIHERLLSQSSPCVARWGRLVSGRGEGPLGLGDQGSRGLRRRAVPADRARSEATSPVGKMIGAAHSALGDRWAEQAPPSGGIVAERTNECNQVHSELG